MWIPDTKHVDTLTTSQICASYLQSTLFRSYCQPASRSQHSTIAAMAEFPILRSCMYRTILCSPHTLTVNLRSTTETFLSSEHLTSNAGFPIPELHVWILASSYPSRLGIVCQGLDSPQIRLSQYLTGLFRERRVEFNSNELPSNIDASHCSCSRTNEGIKHDIPWLRKEPDKPGRKG